MGKIKYILIVLILVPFSSYSQIQGPTQPEFTNFTSINNQEIVNENTGDLNYSIPLLNIPGQNGFGYTLNLSYNSNFGPDDEASWVGWGWRLNLGSITRGKNGFPDDFRDARVIYHNKKPSNVSINLGVNVNAELMSIEPDLSANLNLHYNNENGFAVSYGAGISAIKGIANLNFGVDRSGSFSGGYNFDLSPSNVFNILEDFDVTNDIIKSVQNSSVFRSVGQISPLSQLGITTSDRRFNSIPINPPSYTTSIFTGKFTTRLDAFQKVGGNVNINGSYIEVDYDDIDIKKVYGYFYSDIAEYKNYIRSYKEEENSLKMDYSLDRSNPFTTRDYFLSIPKSNPDEFMVQAEGLSGGFRTHFDKPITFSPSYQHNKNYLFEFGGGINHKPITIDALWGFGLNAGGDVKGGNSISPLVNKFESNQKRFIFHNDKAIHENYFPSLNRPTVDGTSISTSGLDLYSMPNDQVSNFIEYRTIEQVLYTPQDNFNKKLSFTPFAQYYKDLIAEFKVTNTDGNVYVFGEPVFSMNEENLSFLLPESRIGNVENNKFYPYKLNENSLDTKFGTSIHHPYANSYLLTEIRSSNYFDVTNDGPTQDDVGEYVSFQYLKTAGRNIIHDFSNFYYDKWFEWRMPYEGYYYSKGDVSNQEDDIISYSTGQKELLYPQSIKTKTHVAIFITNMSNNDYSTNRHYLQYFPIRDDFSIVIDGNEIGNHHTTKYGETEKLYDLLKGSGDERKDNWPFNSADTEKINRFSHGNYGNIPSNPSRKLERILLFKLDEEKEAEWEKTIKTGSNSLKQVFYVKELVKVINLETDYELRSGTVNSAKVSGEKTGKLTLKKLWSDYNNTFEHQISPYSFQYEYADNTTLDYPSEFNYLEDYAGDKIENPNYSKYQTNAWNNYQIGDDNNSGSISNDYLGSTKSSNLVNSVNNINPDEFDPAAWRLKRITLPSQGEIHVQYDEKDYSNVQNRDVMGMFKLSGYTTSGSDHIYTIDLSDYYSSVDATLADKIREKLSSEFTAASGGKNKKIYGKFLLSYDNDTPEIDDCNSEYIEGFVDVKSITGTGTIINIVLEDDFFSESCIDKYKNTKNGIACNSFLNNNFLTANIDAFLNVVSAITSINWGTIGTGKCSTIEEELSYFRLPLVDINKYSGGARVKRVLYYDKFNEIDNPSNDISLYGTEYFYENENGLSSGVASNEPDILDKENSLISIIELRENLNFIDKFLSNEQEDQSYGPLNKFLLPSPTINYSRVISKKIGLGANDGTGYSKSHDGFTIKEYFTYKDNPFDKDYNLFLSSGEQVKGANHTSIDKYEPYVPLIPNPFLVLDYASITASQGYLFINNKVNGLAKSERLYSGNYFNEDTWSLKYSKEYEYTEPGSCLPLFHGFRYTSNGITPMNPLKLEGGLPGIEIESVLEGKRIVEESNIIQGNYDIDVGLIFVPVGFAIVPVLYPFPSFAAKINMNYRELNTVVNSTFVDFSPTLKSIKETRDGVTNITENLIFDSKTGNPILTRTSDEYDGAFSGNNDGGIYNYSFPASYFYPSFNSKESDPRLRTLNWEVTQWKGWHISHPDWLEFPPFEEFKFIYLTATNTSNAGKYYSVGDKVRLDMRFSGEIYPTEIGNFDPPTPISFDRNNVLGVIMSISGNDIIVVIDVLQLGPLPTTLDDVTLRIDNSRKNNRLNEIADQISIYSADSYTSICNTDIPEHFESDYTHATNSSNQTYDDIIRENIELKNHFNGVIADKWTNSQLTESYIYLDTFDLEIKDAIAGYEPINDTTKIRYSVSIIDTIDLQSPQDSIQVNFITNRMNTLNGTDSISTHPLIKDLNTLLDEFWSTELTNYKNDYSWFTKCLSTDTTGSNISNFFIDKLDSTQNLGLESNSFVKNINENQYLIFEADTNLNIVKYGSDIISIDSTKYKYISFRDLDSNEVIGIDRKSYLGEVNFRFSNDTIVDYFDLGHIKYLKPSVFDVDALSSFKLDCRDTLLVSDQYIADNWDTTFIILPGNDAISDTLFFFDNDSLFNYVDAHSRFTEEFGYFDVNETGMLRYNTIGSDYGYVDTTSTELFKLYVLDTNTYEDIIVQSFIIDPTQPIEPFDIDTNQGASLVTPVNIDSELDFNVKHLVQFREANYPFLKADNVLSANSKTFDIATTELNFSHVRPQTPFLDNYINYNKGEYRYDEQRLYDQSKTYVSGYFDDFVTFNHWNPSQNSTKWQQVSLSKIDQNNHLIELTDVIDNKSTQLFNSRGQTIAVFNNSDLESVYFTSFEIPSTNLNTRTDKSIAHNGNNSLILDEGASPQILDFIIPYGEIQQGAGAIDFPLTQKLKDNGIHLKVWVKIEEISDENYNNPIILDYSLNGTGYSSATITKVTQTGDWSLFESKILPTSLSTGSDNIILSIGFDDAINTIEKVYIDDLLIKPIGSISNCYVYKDNNQNIDATLDDSHLSSKFQYNSKGELVRKIKETYEGIKTVADAQYNTPKVERSTSSSSLRSNPNSIYENHHPNVRVKHSDYIRYMEESKPLESNSKFDVMNININQDSTNVKFFKFLFDNPIDSSKAKENLKVPDFDKLDIPDLPKDSTLFRIDSLNYQGLNNIKSDSINSQIEYNFNNQVNGFNKDFKVNEQDSIRARNELNKIRKQEEE